MATRRGGIGGAARRFSRDAGGMAALEFSFIAPIMIFLFFATVEASEALSSSRRVGLAADTIADLVAQETRVEAGDLDDLFTGVEAIIAPGTVAVDVRVVSLVVDPDTLDVVVHWSRDNAGGTPYAEGAPYTGPADVALVDPGASIIVSEIEFDYEPPLTDRIFKDVTITKDAARFPRRSFRVQFCESGPTACTS